ncbi:FAD-dependent oxidoreductase [uncultured Phenylobacterium sp.]|uniref:FAD-dependent oxidoreductase n=1 Tax=uncultured Phenylobacterium sp. TaxID=349273 RepID=UPI0025CEF09F|nr:FAD-dependent oxidoreductase [uncultured Phenylobacterium sp.]
MSKPAPTSSDTRDPQRFPTLSAAELDRLRGFGTVQDFAAGEALERVGEPGHGLAVIFSGEVEVFGSDELGERTLIVTHRAGGFVGELAQLSGRPALVDALAATPVSALIIPPERLRALLVAEAELGERIMRALILRRVGLLERGSGGPVIVGRGDDADVLRLEGFLTRNGHPHRRLDPAEDADANGLIARFGVAADDLPIVLCPDGSLMRNPPEAQLARCLGLVAPIDPNRLYDVAVVGAGPAGLATAVYAASEGLSVLVLDCRAFGGQAGASARIENYLGFPTGISGLALMARAYNQAQKFGVEMAIPDEVASLSPHPDGGYAVALSNAEQVRTRAVVIAAGARYRRLDAVGLEACEAASVHYWASPLEGRLCAGQEVALVGAGNSAGQAVVYLASQVRKVWMLVRGPGLEASMSRYLIDRIRSLPNVELVTGVEVRELKSRNGQLEAIRWRDRRSGVETERALRHLFLFVGADPHTDWLTGSGVALDAKGFVLTGDTADRRPLETSLPGVFAIGDVRAGSVKRVAAAVGEGAQVVAILHSHLANASA